MGDFNRYIMESILAGKIDKDVAVNVLKTVKNVGNQRGEGIAVIGMALRFPGANSPDEYWDIISNRTHSMRSLPARRKRDADAYLQHQGVPAEDKRYVSAGFLDEVDGFDYRFFRLTPKEASLMDPGQRIFLQTVWSAIEDAGYGGEQLVGSRTGVYVGYATYPSETYYRAMSDIDPTLLESGTVGNIPALLPARISYLLNLRGPAMVVDTACSSSLMTVHLACQAIKQGECDMALAGGVRVSLFPTVRNSVKLGVESSDSITRSFDENSSGAGSGEGVAAVVLKPLQKAISDGDHIYAVIRGGASNQDGSSISITAPNPAAQTDVLLHAWQDAGINPEALAHIECHGTGTRLGDPIEILALERAFSQHTGRKQFCAISSVKTNIGHLNESAGIAGFIKSVLALQHRQLPPSANFNRPNVRIDFNDSPIYVNTKLRNWESNAQKRLCGVSSFGLSGTNCHLVLEEAPEVQPTAVSAHTGPHLLTFSSKSPTALRALIKSYADEVAGQPSRRIEDVCYTTNSGRGHYGYRVAITVIDPTDLAAKLRELCQTELAEARESWLSYGYHRLVTVDSSWREEGDISAATKADLDKQVAERVAAFVASGRTDADLLREIRQLYVGGAQVPWTDFHAGVKYRRTSLPTYPFDDVHCWLEFPGETTAHPEAAELEPLDGVHYRVAWRQEELVPLRSIEPGSSVLLLTADGSSNHPLTGRTVETLEREGFDVIEAMAPGVAQMEQTPEAGAAVEHEYRLLFERMGSMETLRIVHMATLTPENAMADADSLHASQIRGVFNLFHMVRGFLQQNVVKSAEILLVAERVQQVTGAESGLNPQYATLLGLGKGVGSEYPNLRVRGLDIDETTGAEDLLKEMAAEHNMTSVAFRNGVRYVPELQEVEVGSASEGQVPVREGGVYLITGGFGGIGLAVAKTLASRARVRLALIGRSGVPDRAEWDRILADGSDPKLCSRLQTLVEIEAGGSEVLCFRADVSREEQLRPVVVAVRAKYGFITGVVHSAGVPRPHILVRKELSEFIEVAGPKVEGAWLLDHLTVQDSLDFFVMFSSGVTLIGEASQGDYVAANSFLDAYSAYRARTRGGRTLTIDWVSWRDIGMAVEWGINVDTFFKALPTEVALRALDQAMGMSGDRYMIGEINPAWYAQWIKLAEVFPYRLSDKIARVFNQAKALMVSPEGASELTVTDEQGRMAIVPLSTARKLRSGTVGTVTLKGKTNTDFSDIERRVAAIYSEVLGYAEINIYDSFFELGGDSILLARAYRLIDKEFPGVVSMTTLFEHTSVSKLAAYVQGGTGSEPAVRSRPVKTKAAAPRGGEVAIIGLAFELAGANTLDGLRDVVFGGVDCVRSFPAGRRADMDRYIDFLHKAKMGGAGVLEGMEYAPGGYLDDVAGFDYKLFRVSPKEASLMDPSQRAFLETIWRTIEDAGYGCRIEGTRTGVWVGYSHFSTYMQMVMNAEPGFLADAIPGNLSNMMSGRISYLFDLKGPGVVVDAACASSLLSVHLACQSLRAGECDMALAGGIRLHLLPQDHPALKLGIEASDGMTCTFDNGAAGAGHGEGVAALLLKPLDQAERDGDHIYAVIKGSAVNQDGRSMSLTAPNPQAQLDVITEAWATAGIDPEALCYIEAHGTATPLGDPIEVDALQRAFSTYTDRKQFCAVGSIKANMGHLYECAGMAGLLKSILILQDRQLPPAVHFQRPNAKIDFAAGALYVNAVRRPIETDGRPALCAVSGFGVNGTNSHVVLQEYRSAAVRITEAPAGIQILPMAAKSQDALLRLVQDYRDFLRKRVGNVRLVDIVGTAATGRGHYEHRLALAVSSTDELLSLVERIGETGFQLGDAAVSYAQHKIVTEGKENRAAWEITAKEKAALTDQSMAVIDQFAEHPYDAEAAAEVCRLYVQGADIDWEHLMATVDFRRISLPGYPFERTKCWVQIPTVEDAVEQIQTDSAFFNMRWREVPLTVHPGHARVPEGTALLFRPTGSMEEVAAGLAAELRQHGLRVVEALTGCDRFGQASELVYQLGDGEGDYQRLLQAADQPPGLMTIFFLVDSAGDRFATLAELQDHQRKGAFSLFCLARALEALEREIEVIVVGRNVQQVTGKEREVSPSAGSVFGLNKVIRREYPNLVCRRIDLDGDTPVADLMREWKYGGASLDVAYRQGARYESEFSAVDLRSTPDTPLTVREDGVYLITGGAGGIGLEMARFLASRGRVKLALINRSKLPDRTQWAWIAAQPDHKLHRKILSLREIEALGAEVVLYDASVADESRMADITGALRARYGRINGVIHAAGISRDRLIGERAPNGFEWEVLSPKVYGTWVLDRVTAQDALDFFIQFSSVATYFPTAGQGEYVAGNAYLDGFAAWRNMQGKPTVNINWTTWKETGMAFASGFTIDTMFKAQPTSTMMARFEQMLSQGISNALVGELNYDGGGLTILDRSQVKLSPELRREVDQHKARAGRGTQPAAKSSGAARADILGGKSDGGYTSVERTLAGTFQEVLGLDYIDVYDNFFELGAESIMLIRIQKRLEGVYPGLVTVTDMFEHTSIYLLAKYMSSQMSEEEPAPVLSQPTQAQVEAAPAAQAPQEPTSDFLKDALKGLLKDALNDLMNQGATTTPQSESAKSDAKDEADTEMAIIGIGERLPGCDDLEDFWTKIRTGTELTGKLPASRLPDINRYLAVSKPFPDGTYELADGAYLGEIDKFDYGFFRLSPREAALMDPNHRLALMTAWEAVEDAGYGGTRIAGTSTGVFFGFSSNVKDTYARYIFEFDPLSLLAAELGNTQSVLTGRISYLMDLKGPSVVVDTACSSSLTAIHLAAQAIRRGDCEMALVGGISLMTLPVSFLDKPAGMGSSDAYTRTFDYMSEGTALGEGVATILIKPLKAALRDGDNIHAVIKGSALNQDGSSVGLSAPNPVAQQQLLLQAWDDARVEPESIAYIEAHGTATPLGDPIEVRAINNAFAQRTDKRHFCALGSVKSNMGHLSQAAGMAGVLKAVLAMKHKEHPPTINFQRPNDKVDFIKSAVYVNSRLHNWEDGPYPRRCGVSGFGISGTNAHVVLEEAPRALIRQPAATTGLQVLTLSARTPTALAAMVRAYAQRVADLPGLQLGDVCYTASTGRGHYGYRLALIVANPTDFKAKLQELCEVDFTTAEMPWITYGYHRIVSGERKHLEPGDLTRAEMVELGDKASALVDQFTTSARRDAALLHQICRLYSAGADLPWAALYQGEQRRKVSLPTYPFEGTRCWIDLPAEADVLPPAQMKTPGGLFYSVGWSPDENVPAVPEGMGERVLLLTTPAGRQHALVGKMTAELGRAGFEVLEAEAPDTDLVAHGWDASALVENAYTEMFQRVGSTERLHVLHMATLPSGTGITDAQCLEQSQAMGMLSLYHLVRGFSKQRDVKAADILVVSERVHEVTGEESSLNPQYASLFGLGKCVGQEYPGLSVRSVDVDEHTAPEQILAELGAAEDRMNPVAYRNGKRFAQQLSEVTLDKGTEPVAIRKGGLYLITGGTGGIGLAVAQRLAERQPVRLALVSRTGLPERVDWDRILTEGTDAKLCAKLQLIREIEQAGSEVLSCRADVAKEEELRPVIEGLRERYGRIDGVVHSAGIPGASILIQKELQSFLDVATPKVQGTWLLDQLTEQDAPDFFVMCSSASTLSGEASMGDYVAANTFQDAYASYRSRTGRRTLTLNWVAWRDTGMGVDFGVNIDGVFKALPTNVGVDAFEQALNSSLQRAIVGELNPGMAVAFARISDLMPCRLSPLMREYAAQVKASLVAPGAPDSDVALIENGKMTVIPQSTLAKMRKSNAGAITLKGKAGAAFSEIERKVAAIYSEVLGYQEINVYDTFFELGGDSIMLSRVYTLVDKEFPGVLRMSDLFEHTSVSKLAAYVQRYTETKPTVPSKPAMLRAETPGSGDVAIIGLAFEMPGANTLDGLRDIVFGGGEVIRNFPDTRRRDMDRYLAFVQENGADAMILGDELKYSAGGYLNDISRFDYKAFRLSPKEASLTDPAQRAFLQTTWRAIEDAGYGGKIDGSRTGVWVGYSANDTYQRMVFQAEPDSLTQSLVGNMSNMMAGRVAYTYNLRGPSMVLDTACSSSLVAVHQACNALNRGECDMAIAGGVKLHMLPQDHPVLQIGNETSDGTTRSFDEHASGAGKGEGVAALLLKPRDQAERDGDHIYAVIKGSAVNHGGRAMSVTAPNPVAQAEVITDAWANAGINPEALCYLEAHGAATRLGDPIEFDALQRAFSMFTDRKQFCAIGSIKANMGHLFECGGMASLLKAILILTDRLLPPAVHFNRPNAKIDFSDSALYVNSVARPIAADGRRAACAVNGFGISGTNSHVVLEEYRPAEEAVATESGFNLLLPLSARSEAALLQLVHTYRDFLRNIIGKVRLTDIVGTAATGRWHHEHRLALSVRSVADLCELLERIGQLGLPTSDSVIFYAQHKVVPDGMRVRAAGEITGAEKVALGEQASAVGDRFLANPDDAEAVAELCKLYVQGADIDWDQVLAEMPFRRVSIPGYPFEQHKCWIEVPGAVRPGKQVRTPKRSRKSDWRGLEIAGRPDGRYSDVERTIARVWGELLGFSEINIYDSYIELGGDSISGLKIANIISKELRRTVSMADLLKYTTVIDLAHYVETACGEGIGQNPAAADLPSLVPVDKREFYPVSPLQRGLYLLNEMEEVRTSYNVPSANLIKGELDMERLQDALCKLVAQHEGLRTSFHLVNGEPVQVIHDTVDVPLEYLDVEESTDDAEMMQRAREAFARFLRPFDLKVAPLFRFGVAKLSPRRFLLLADNHHIISDGMTQEILASDFVKAYRGEELTPLPIQYKDYAVWMHELSEGEFMRKQEQYWLQTLAEEAPALQLPTDYPRPLQQTFEGGHVTFTLTGEQTEGLHKLARENGTTLYTVLLTVFKVLLWKYSGQEDIVVASPVVGRSLPELEKVAGIFVNTILMRSHPAGTQRFRQFLNEVRVSTVEALANQHYPYATLVEKVSRRRDPSRNPLFDVMFILQNYGQGEARFAESLGEPVNTQESLFNPAAKFDISIAAVEVTDGISFDVEYRTRLFREETMVRLGQHFGRIVDEVTSNPEVALDQVDIITARERDDILERFNSTASAYEQDLPLQLLFERQAERTPERTALVWQDTVLTYGELNRQANALAGTLRDRGVGREALVAVMMERSHRMVVSIIGVLKAGGAYLPVDPDYPADRIRFMLEDSGTSLVLTESALVDKVPAVVQDKLCIDTLDLDEGGGNLPNVNDPGDLAFVLYTSGTSGNPKGVMLEHRNIVAYVHAFTSEMGPTWDQAVLQVSSFSFDAFVEEVYPTLLGGGRLLIPTGKEFLDMARFAELVNTHGVTLISTSPLLLAEVNGREGLEGLGTVISGGDVLKPEYVSNLVKHARVFNTYGPTETAVCATYYRYTGTEPTHSIPLGKPIANYRVYLFDQGSRLTPVGVPGELWIAGAGVSRGYLNRTELTAERFLPDPWVPGERMYRTGDLARWLPDGNIEFLGRLDNQVKIRGFRVELGEIETMLMQHAGVREAVVIAREDQPGNLRLVAYIVAVGEAALDAAELRSFARLKLPEYMVPSAFVTLPALPLTSNAKVDIRTLPMPDPNHEGLRAAYAAPRTATEEVLAGVWAELLGLEKVGVHDNFFDLGGHSLLAMRMASRVRDALGVELALRSLFETATVGELAEKVEEAMLAQLSEQELASMLTELEEDDEQG